MCLEYDVRGSRRHRPLRQSKDWESFQARLNAVKGHLETEGGLLTVNSTSSAANHMVYCLLYTAVFPVACQNH